MFQLIAFANRYDISYLLELPDIKNSALKYFTNQNDFINFFNLNREIIDCVFISLDMEDCDTLVLADNILKYSPELDIIFIVEKSSDLLQDIFTKSLRLKPFGIIQKPIANQVVYELMKQLRQKKLSIESKKRVIKTTTCLMNINLRDVVYGYSLARLTYLRLSDGSKIEMKYTMKQLEELVDHPAFIRCHQSFLINMYEIRQFNYKSITMTDNQVIFLSRNKQKELKSVIFDFWNYTDF